MVDLNKEAGGDASVDDSKVAHPEDNLISLKVLPLLKERQQQHGLRHGDFQRYHAYCSRRLRRLRETLGLPQGDKRHFKKKEITTVELDSEKADSRHLEIPLTITERAWACAMELKQDANTEPRKRFHMMSRLKKAVTYGNALLQIAQAGARIDARTKLECEAYASFVNAVFCFEKEDWKNAMEFYKKTQVICNKIAQALGDHPDASIYTEKASEIIPAMRFCSYKSGGGAELKISDLSSEYQSAAIEAMIAQRPKMSEITFRNHKISVPNEKISVALVKIEEFEKKPDKKIEMYEQILVDLRDTIQLVRDLVKPDQQGPKTKPSLMLGYLLYLRLRLTNSRTELMIKEKSSPKDKIRLIEMVIHNFGEMKTIPGFDADEDFQQEVEDCCNVFRGIRCRHIAEVYQYNKRWGEAASLFKRAEEYLRRSLKGLAKDSPYIDMINFNLREIEASSIECRAQSILSDADEDDPFQLQKPEKPLVDRLDEFVLDESLLSDEPNIITFPPDFKPVPCKPLFFDLAGSHVGLPIAEIEERAGVKKKSSPSKESSGGITGLVKGLWGWGSNK